MTTAADTQLDPEPPTTAEPPARSFWLFWGASTVSATGDAVTAVALPLTAITVLHASPFAVSLLTAATYVAWVVIGLPAGALVHRRRLRRVQLISDGVRGVAMASVPVAAWSGVLSMAQLVGVALVVSFATVAFDVANSTFIVEVVSSDDLTRRNSLTSGTVAVTQTGGPSLGGALVQLIGAAGAVVVDAVSYLLSALLLSRLPESRAGAATPATPVRVAVRDGWRYVVGHPVVRPCAAMATAVNFVCGGVMALAPLFLVRTLHAPIGLVGVLLASEGVGSLAGAALTTRLAARLGSARLLLRAASAGGLLALLMPLATPGAGLLVFALGSAGFAAGVVVLSILARTHRQQTTPPDLLPRVMATVRFLSWGVIPLGALLAGVLAQTLGVREALWVFALLALAAPAIGASSAIRGRRDLD